MEVNRQVAVNSAKIGKLIIEINQYSIKMKKIFSEYEDIINGLTFYYDCDSAKQFKSRFNQFKQNFPIMVNNLLSYKKDMQIINSRFNSQSSVLTDVLSHESMRVQSKNN